MSQVSEDSNQVLALLREIQAEIRAIAQRLSPQGKPYLTVAEIAELTGRSAYTVRRWINSGTIRAVRVRGSGPKGRLLVPREQVSSLIAAGRGGRTESRGVLPDIC